MTGLGVDRRDDPVGRDPPRDPKRPVLAPLEVLAHERGQQLRRLRHLGRQLAAIERQQQRVGVGGERVDKRPAGVRVVVVADRLASGGVVVLAPQRPPSTPSRSASQTASRPRIPEQTSVTVSIVATAS